MTESLQIGAVLLTAQHIGSFCHVSAAGIPGQYLVLTREEWISMTAYTDMANKTLAAAGDEMRRLGAEAERVSRDHRDSQSLLANARKELMLTQSGWAAEREEWARQRAAEKNDG